MPDPIHTCSCGRRYTADEWARLPLVGVQHVPAGDGEPEEWQELRNCTCGSTRARELSADLDEFACNELLTAGMEAEFGPLPMPSMELVRVHSGQPTWRTQRLMYGGVIEIGCEAATPLQAVGHTLLGWQRDWQRALRERRCA